MRQLLPIFFLVFVISFINARELHVGEGQEYSSLSSAASDAQPGDAIIVHNGVYTQREDISNLNGELENPIIIYAEEEGKVVYTGQSEAWHLSSCTHLFIYGFVFKKQTSNGVNIDDSGNYDGSTYDITIRNCVFRDMDASGNNDMLKLSGLDNFKVENCRFINGADGGSGIDMVGCHNGLFAKNKFENMGSNCIQVKGGSQFITIVQNTFKNGGKRSLNLGGSTGLQYFRPQDAAFEAADILVRANVFIGSWAPIAYVGSTRVKVINNTFFKPENWVFRILQETVDTTRFVACSDNVFSNNIIYFGNSLHRIVNIGPNTKAETFNFECNLWYNFEDSTFNNPNLPVTEINSIIQKDPLFANADSLNFELLSNSPAIEKGKKFNIQNQLDFKDRYLHDTCSIGALEYDGIYKDFTGDIGTKWQYDHGGKNGYQYLEITDKSILEDKEVSNVEFTIPEGCAYILREFALYTKDHKVFYREKDEDEDEYLSLYDFNLKKDDEFFTNHYDFGRFLTRIEAIKFRFIAGKVRKVQVTVPIIILDLGYDQGYLGEKGEIVEGINSIKSFMFGNLYENQYYNKDSLRCFTYFNEEGNLSIEKFVDYPCDTLTVGTDNPDFAKSIFLYPNPAQNFVDLYFENDFTGKIEIFSITGQKLKEEKAKYIWKKRIDLSQYNNGCYLAKIKGANNTATKKFIISR